VASIEQLSQSSPQQLHRLVLRLHVALLQRRDLTPGVNQVQTWVQQAKTIVSG
jgi:signal transduction histidine kinase